MKREAPRLSIVSAWPGYGEPTARRTGDCRGNFGDSPLKSLRVRDGFSGIEGKVAIAEFKNGANREISRCVAQPVTNKANLATPG